MCSARGVHAAPLKDCEGVIGNDIPGGRQPRRLMDIAFAAFPVVSMGPNLSAPSLKGTLLTGLSQPKGLALDIVNECPWVDISTSDQEILPGDAAAFFSQGSTGVSYFWDFGNGTTSSESAPTHGRGRCEATRARHVARRAGARHHSLQGR